jgi:O-antigen ligase
MAVWKQSASGVQERLGGVKIVDTNSSGSAASKWLCPESMILFAFFGFALLGLQLNPELQQNDVLTGQGNVIRQSFYIFALVASVVFLKKNGVSPSLSVRLPVLFLLAWCTISLTWAVDPFVGLRRLLLTVVVFVTIYRCVDVLGTNKTAGLMRLLLACILILNYYAVFFTNLGVHLASEMDPSIVGDWRGFLVQKNFAGPACAFTIMFFLFSKGSKAIRFTVVALSTNFLIFTNSKTSIALLVLSLVVGLCYRASSFRYKILIVPVLAYVVALAVVYEMFYIDDVSEWLLNPDSLTGRTVIWQFMCKYASDHSVLGAGFGSFWNIGDASPINDMTNGWVSKLTQGHNGYLDVLVQLGTLGVTLCFAALFVIPLWRLTTQPQADSATSTLAVSIIFFAAAHNLTETSVLDRDSLVWIFLVLANCISWKSEAEAGDRHPAVDRT